MSLLNEILDEEPLEPEEEEPQRPRIEIAGSILAVDIGTVFTRALLFDVVEGSYRFVSRGQAPTTAGPPWNNALLGVNQAIDQIAEATDHTLFDNDGELIIPEHAPFIGVGAFAATASAGEPIRAILTGLMPSVSIASGRRIAASSYLRLIDTFSLADRRSQEKQIDGLLDMDPNLILIVGGTDGGAKDSMRKQIETIALACSLIEFGDRPAVLYAGNQELKREVLDKLGEEIELHTLVADNVRPTLDTENLESVQHEMAKLFNIEKSLNTGGFAEVREWTREGVLPTAHSFSRTVQILGHLGRQSVLGIDLASSATTIAASIKGTNYLNVFDELGMGHSASGVASQIRPQNIARWLSYEPRDLDEVLDAIWNRWLYPHTVPVTAQELEFEYAVAREVIRLAAGQARKTWRGVRQHGLIPTFDTVILSGATLSNAPHYGWSAMAVLDALLPTGMTRLLVDPYAMGAALGAIAPLSPKAVVQILDTGAFVDLGTVISVTGRARRGDIVVRGALKSKETGEQHTFEVPFGSIVRLPLQPGEESELTFQAQRVDIDIDTRRRRKMTVTGGELGLIIDARGRPWRFPRSYEEHRAWLKEWQAAITQEQVS